jgi:membrane-associated phospholipid phosphatase
MKNFLNTYLVDIRDLTAGAFHYVRIRWFFYCLLLALAVGITVALWYPDTKLLPLFQIGSPSALSIARSISFWGDYVTGILPLVLVLLIFAALRKNKLWRRAALACLLAASLSGIFTNCLRLTLGRPRPSAELPKAFHGLQPRAKYHGFPSGHSTTAFAAASALTHTIPVIGVPSALGAAAVAWSRMELNRHFLSDVLVGGIIGWGFGLAFARGAQSLPAGGRPPTPPTSRGRN